MRFCSWHTPLCSPWGSHLAREERDHQLVAFAAKDDGSKSRGQFQCGLASTRELCVACPRSERRNSGGGRGQPLAKLQPRSHRCRGIRTILAAARADGYRPCGCTQPSCHASESTPVGPIRPRRSIAHSTCGLATGFCRQHFSESNASVCQRTLLVDRAPADLEAELDAAWARGCRAVKLKVGRDIGAESRLANAIRESDSRPWELRLDANGSWTAQECAHAWNEFQQFRPAFIEEPLRFDELEELVSLDVPFALDESLARLSTDQVKGSFKSGVAACRGAQADALGWSADLYRTCELGADTWGLCNCQSHLRIVHRNLASVRTRACSRQRSGPWHRCSPLSFADSVPSLQAGDKVARACRMTPNLQPFFASGRSPELMSQLSSATMM